jgi:hypothetical protein
MEKAKEFVRDMLPSIADPNLELSAEDRQSLKIEINTLLHTNLPAYITVGQMEVLAFCIHSMIVSPNDFLDQ